MKTFLPRILAALLIGLPTLATAAPTPTPGPASAIRWKPEADMDRQLFPSLIIATADRRPGADDDKPSPDLLGDPYGLLGISAHATQPGTRIKVTVRDNEILNASTWSGTLPKGDHTYYIAPSVAYKYDALRHVRQQHPLTVQFDVEINGQSAGRQSETVTLRSVNDCPFAVKDAEATLDERNKKMPGSGEKDSGMHGASDSALGWMFAAYVNEDHPVIDALLNEALHTGIISSVDGYQGGKPEDALRQAFAIWKVLQDRGIRYSNIVTVPGGGEKVASQYVRFVEESLRHQQANCVDGSVLFASVLRKMGLAPFLVIVPRHMYLGVALSPRDDDDSVACIETTMLGAADLDTPSKVPPVVTRLEQKLNENARANASWRTFKAAVAFATAAYHRDKAKFDDDNNPDYQVIDVAAARADGVMPIPFDRSETTPELPGGPAHTDPPAPEASARPLPTPFVKPPPAATPAPGSTPEADPGAPRFPKPTPRHAPSPTPAVRPSPTPGKDGDFDGFFDPGKKP